MSAANTKLTTAVEDDLNDLRRIRASGGTTAERSRYTPPPNLLNAVGNTLKPKVFCVTELADQGAGHPDFGLYTAKQGQKGQPKEGQTTFDIYLNGNAYWRNVPTAVWRYKLGGYQVLKKWLSYRERAVLGQALLPEGVLYFAEVA